MRSVETAAAGWILAGSARIYTWWERQVFDRCFQLRLGLSSPSNLSPMPLASVAPLVGARVRVCAVPCGVSTPYNRVLLRGAFLLPLSENPLQESPFFSEPKT